MPVIRYHRNYTLKNLFVSKDITSIGMEDMKLETRKT